MRLLLGDIGVGVLFVLALVNGANDVGKSVAPLVATLGPVRSVLGRRALLWGGLLSGVGSLAAILLSGRLFLIFTQRLIETTPTPAFAVAALTGATVWVLIATLFRLPVSTTHAIIGAIVLPTLYLHGAHDIQWEPLALRVLLPLAASPILALFLTYFLGRLHIGPTDRKNNPKRTAFLHWASAGATSFARGMNDAPKMAALGSFLLLGGVLGTSWFPYIVVAVAVPFGSLTWGHWITEALIRRVPPIDHEKHFRAGLTTAALVSAGALVGAPLSTTHVSAGATAGTHLGLKGIARTFFQDSVLPWCVTFPVAGALAVGLTLVGA